MVYHYSLHIGRIFTNGRLIYTKNSYRKLNLTEIYL